MGKLKHTTSPSGSTTPVHTTTPNNEGIQPSQSPQPTAEQLDILKHLARGYALYYYQTETEVYGHELTYASAYMFGNYTHLSVSLKDFYTLVKHNWISSSAYWANQVSTTPTDGYWLTDSGKAVVLAALDAAQRESDGAK